MSHFESQRQRNKSQSTRRAAVNKRVQAQNGFKKALKVNVWLLKECSGFSTSSSSIHGCCVAMNTTNNNSDNLELFFSVSQEKCFF